MVLVKPATVVGQLHAVIRHYDNGVRKVHYREELRVLQLVGSLIASIEGAADIEHVRVHC